MKNKKIKSQKEISDIVSVLRKQGKKITAYSGSFDILHWGHVAGLEEAKEQGDILIVLLNSDKSVKSYKGPNRPIVGEKERALMLESLECVDYVVIFDELTPKNVLVEIKPDVYCSGPDWGRDCVEKELVEKNGGKIHVLAKVSGLSTTNLIEKILGVYSAPETKAVFLDRDGTINHDPPSYVSSPKDFKFIPETLSALKILSKSDYKIIIVSNQSGIGRGYFKEKDVENLHKWMLGQLKKKGIRIDKIYYCPHREEDNCGCRKPKPGMILSASKEFGLNLNKSWIIGNEIKDVQVGREANVRTIKLGKKIPAKIRTQPDFYAKDLKDAVKKLLNKK